MARDIVSDARIALAAIRAEFPVDEVPTAVAICLAESGGDRLAVGVNKPHDGFPETEDRGLAQINQYWNPLLFQKYDWRDIDQNLVMAKAVWDEFVKADGNGWRGWSTFNSSAYAKYLPRGEAAYRSLHRYTLTRYLFCDPQALHKGHLMHGQDVLALQKALGMAPKSWQDSYFGTVTEVWVKDFQRRYGLVEDGVVGPQVCKKLGWGFQGPR